MSVLEPATSRRDLVIAAGEVFDICVPILDALDNPVEISDDALASWSATADIRAHPGAAAVLVAWTTEGQNANAAVLAGDPGLVRLQASAEQTAGWLTSWPDLLAVVWRLHVVAPVDPDIPEITEPTRYRIAQGRVRLVH